MAILLFACLTVLFALFSYWKRSRFFQFLLQFLPFCFLFFFLWFVRDHYEIVQVHKLGYQFEKITNDYRSPSRSVIIGGNQEVDDLFSQKLPASAVKITPSLNDNSLDVRALQDGVLIVCNGEPLNEVRLHDGDRVTIGKQEMLYRANGAYGRSFSNGGKIWNWPRESKKVGKITKPAFTAGFQSQLHSMGEIGSALNLPFESRGAIFLEAFHFAPGRRPLEMNAVGLIGIQNVTVNSIRAPDHFVIHDGDVIALYAISSDENGAHTDSAFIFRINNGDSLAFYNQNPQTIGMKEELLRSGNVEKPLLITTTTLPYSAFPTVHYGLESDRFNALSAFVQLEHQPEDEGLFAHLHSEIMKLLAIDQRHLEIVTDDGVFHPQDSQPFALGKAERILFSLHEVRFPWQLLQIFLLLTVLKMIFQPPFFESLANPPAQLMLITIDFFLALRLLFAFRADSLFPFSQKALDLSLFAWLLIPYLLFAAIVCKREVWERSHALNFVAYSLLAVIVSALFFQQYLFFVCGIVLVANTVAFLRFHPRSMWPRMRASMEALQQTRVEMIALVILIVALALYFFAAGEALEIRGMRVPLAIFYHPAFLLLSCKYLLDLNRLAQAEKTEERLRDIFRLLLKSGLLFAEFLFISFLMADLGFFLLYCLPVLFLLFGSAVLLISQYELKWKLAGVLSAVPLLLVFIALFSTSTIEGILPQSYFENRYIQRILLAVDPTALEESGLITAERQLGHERTFLAYAHGGWRGAGYMQRPITTALSSTALNDNVPAVFLLDDFGVFGAAGLILVLLLWIWLWTKTRPDPGFTYSRMLSLAALVTFVFVDIYMIFSNCGIFLFTGKNVFLWGLNSTSDLIHSSLLLALLLLPISKIPETAVPATELELPMSFVSDLRRV
jgi:hypothetical protein